MFLQEIAILFIYYLFLGLLDLIDFGNEKPFMQSDSFHFSPLYTHKRWAVDNGQKLDFQAWNLGVVCHLIVKGKGKKKKKIRNANFWHYPTQLLSQQILKVWSQNVISMTQHGLKPWLQVLFVRTWSRAVRILKFSCLCLWGENNSNKKHFNSALIWYSVFLTQFAIFAAFLISCKLHFTFPSSIWRTQKSYELVMLWAKNISRLIVRKSIYSTLR